MVVVERNRTRISKEEGFMKQIGSWLRFSKLVMVFLILAVPFKAKAATTWDTSVSLTQNTTINGDLVVNKELHLNGWKLTVNGNMIANNSVYTGEYGKLEINGNYTQKSEKLDCKNGTVDVKGNLNICGLDNEGNVVKGNSVYISDNGASTVNVGKNLLIDTTYAYRDGMGNGTYNVKGNFTDKYGIIWKAVNLTGDVSSSKKQSVSISNNGKITTLTLKSCPKFYKLSKGSYDKLVYSHKWDDGVVTKEPTTTEEGIRTYTCTRCGETKTAKIPKKKGAEKELIEGFVSRLYTKALGRDFDPNGLQYWVERLETQVDDGANVAYGFITSTEFKSRNLSDDQFVEVMYATFFDRASDEGGKSYWMGMLNNGTSREAVLAGFVKSQEFDNLCTTAGIERGLILDDGTPVNAGIYQFVKRQYTCCLQRDGEREGMDYWATKIATREITAGNVAKQFFFSDEFVNKGLSDEQYVERLYVTFLNRPFDPTGYEYWNRKMQNGETRAQILDEFASSVEFESLLRSFGL